MDLNETTKQALRILGEHPEPTRKETMLATMDRETAKREREASEASKALAEKLSLASPVSSPTKRRALVLERRDGDSHHGSPTKRVKKEPVVKIERVESRLDDEDLLSKSARDVPTRLSVKVRVVSPKIEGAEKVEDMVGVKEEALTARN